MTAPPHSRKTSGLTGESFAKFLADLDPDPERAGERYEQLRQKLIRIFEWRGSAMPEELADETLNRLAKKITEGEVIRSLASYAGGMARLVWLEALKEQERERRALESLSISSQYASSTDSPRIECFESCLESLTVESRSLILDYYREEKSAKIELRKRLAEKLGMPLNALRIQAHRIRVKLEACVDECLKKSEQG